MKATIHVYVDDVCMTILPYEDFNTDNDLDDVVEQALLMAADDDRIKEAQ